MWLASGASLRMGAPPSRATSPSQALPYLCQPSKSAKQQKYFATDLGNKASCPLPPQCHRPDPCISWRFPGYHFVLRRISPFCSLKFSVLQMTTFYKPISEEVDSFQGQGENTGSNTRRLCFALSFNCATKLPQSFPARAESY